MSEVFERWLPGLRLRRVQLSSGPTPPRALELDGARIWVKDEGRAAPRYGGNKVRKLEWLLGAAVEREATDLLTLGAGGSHHVLATALHARALGLAVHAVLFPQPLTAHALANLAASAAHCASLSVVSGMAGLIPGLLRQAIRIRRETGRWPLFIPQGGSSPLGTLGWVEAGLEIAQAVARGEMPEPERVYVPYGSGGTAAGLLLGLRLAGLGTEIVAVRVVDRPFATALQLRALARAAARTLRAGGAHLPRLSLSGLRIVHDRLAGGYGRTDAVTEEALARAASLGLSLEETYTGKAFSALLAELGSCREPLFIQTVNGWPLQELPFTDPLPEALRPALVPQLRAARW